MHSGDELFGDVIYTYTAEDAVSDGISIPIGTAGDEPVYFTSSPFSDGYERQPEKIRELVERGLELLRQPEEEDTDYMRLRVVEKDRIWAILDGDGYKFMKLEDY